MKIKSLFLSALMALGGLAMLAPVTASADEYHHHHHGHQVCHWDHHHHKDCHWVG